MNMAFGFEICGIRKQQRNWKKSRRSAPKEKERRSGKSAVEREGERSGVGGGRVGPPRRSSVVCWPRVAWVGRR